MKTNVETLLLSRSVNSVQTQSSHLGSLGGVAGGGNCIKWGAGRLVKALAELNFRGTASHSAAALLRAPMGSASP